MVADIHEAFFEAVEHNRVLYESEDFLTWVARAPKRKDLAWTHCHISAALLFDPPALRQRAQDCMDTFLAKENHTQDGALWFCVFPTAQGLCLLVHAYGVPKKGHQ